MKQSLKILKFFFAIFAIALTFAAFGMPELFGGLGVILAAPLVLATIENSDDAKVDRSKILDRMDEMIQLRKTEKRTFTDDEQKEYDQLKTDCDKLNKHIEQLIDEEKRAFMRANSEAKKSLSKQSPQEKETAQIRKFSFLKVVQAGIEKRDLDGLEAEMAQEAKREFNYANIGKSLEGVGVPSIVFRSLTATGETSNEGDQGGNWIPTEKSGLMMALRPRLVMSQLGARFISGLQGNVDFPKGASVTGGWKGEIVASDESTPITSVVSLNPNRLPLVMKYSKQLMLQSSPDVERFLLENLLGHISQAVDQGAINGLGTATHHQPLGILSTSGIGSTAIGDNGGAPTYAHIVDLESKVAAKDADIGALAYLTNTKVRGKLKTTLKATGYPGFVFENGDTPLNGYRAGITNMVPSDLTKGGGSALSAIIFGNFNDLVIGNWGGMDVVIDPYSSKATGQVEIGANTYWDAKVLRAESFAACVDATT